MPKRIKIGFLNPYSGIYPYYAQHIMAGILLGMGLDPASQQTVEFIPVYTNMGGVKDTLEAAKKLLYFDRVDVLSGLVSSYVLADLQVLLEGKQVLPLFFNLGENLPKAELFSPDVFINSQMIWKTQFALGKWAQKEFGGTGFCVMPFYESGYQLFAAFKKGAEYSGASETGLTILPQSPDNSSYMDLTGFFETIRSKQPSYIHAIFCGKMGNMFIKEWFDQDFSKTIPLVVVENMAYEDMLDDVSHMNLHLYTASSWSSASELPENSAFVKLFENIAGQKANIFALVGYESGLAIRQIQSHLEKGDFAAAKYVLYNQNIYGPRAERNFNLSKHSSSTLDILSIKTINNNIYQTILDQDKGVDHNAPEFYDILQGELTGWQNPYMCI